MPPPAAVPSPMLLGHQGAPPHTLRRRLLLARVAERTFTFRFTSAKEFASFFRTGTGRPSGLPGLDGPARDASRRPRRLPAARTGSRPTRSPFPRLNRGGCGHTLTAPPTSIRRDRMHFHPDTLRQIDADRGSPCWRRRPLSGSPIPANAHETRQFLRPRPTDRPATAPCGQLGRPLAERASTPHLTEKDDPPMSGTTPCTETADENDIPRGAQPMYVRRLLAGLRLWSRPGALFRRSRPPRTRNRRVSSGPRCRTPTRRSRRPPSAELLGARSPRDQERRYPFRVAGYAISGRAASAKTASSPRREGNHRRRRRPATRTGGRGRTGC